MSRVEIIGDATLYLGDCREILPTLDKVDAVVTDPPYGVTQEEWDEPFRQEWLNECLNSAPLTIAINAARPDIQRHMLSLSPIADRIIAWRQPKVKALSGMFWSWQPIYVWGKIANCWDTIEFPVDGKNYEHPTQKPIVLMKWLVRSSEALTVIDPFMGSGTTGVACLKLGRKFTGIEREPKYFDVARRRIEEAARQGDMFLGRRAAAVQEQLDLDPLALAEKP